VGADPDAAERGAQVLREPLGERHRLSPVSGVWDGENREVGESESRLGSARLVQAVLCALLLVELCRERFGHPPAERLLDEPAGLAALGAGEAAGLDRGAALRVDGHLDRFHAPPPTPMVRRIEPSASACSLTAWPRRRASRRAFSTA